MPADNPYYIVQFKHTRIGVWADLGRRRTIASAQNLMGDYTGMRRYDEYRFRIKRI